MNTKHITNKIIKDIKLNKNYFNKQNTYVNKYYKIIKNNIYTTTKKNLLKDKIKFLKSKNIILIKVKLSLNLYIEIKKEILNKIKHIIKIKSKKIFNKNIYILKSNIKTHKLINTNKTIKKIPGIIATNKLKIKNNFTKLKILKKEIIYKKYEYKNIKI